MTAQRRRRPPFRASSTTETPAASGTARAHARLKRWLVLVCAALICVVIAFMGGRLLQPIVGDYLLTRLSAPKPFPDNVVIVGFDDETLAGLPYRSPIDRGFLAQIINHVDMGAPKAIGVDILIDQSSEQSKDDTLKHTLRTANAPLVMGYATEEDGLATRQIEYETAFLDSVRKGLVALARDENDGVIRQIISGRETGGEWMPSLPAAMLEAAGTAFSQPSGRIAYLRTATGAPAQVPIFPAHAVLLLPSTWFADKYVLIGTILPTSDRHLTPFSLISGAEAGTWNGIVIHAHILAQLLRGDALTTTPPLMSLLIVCALITVSFWLFTTNITPPWRFFGLTFLLSALWAAGIYAFRVHSLLLPLAASSIGILLASAGLTIRLWMQDRNERFFIREAFSRYVSPALITRLMADPNALKLGGEKRMITYIFTDLENFTSLSEGLPPEQVAILLNQYLDEVCALFIEEHATIDKIVGDAVIGFFGAPEPQDDQSSRAVKLALKVDKFCEDFRQNLRKNGIELGATRIGVHRGEAIIGNFGGSRFFDYTGIGDTVNTAARLEAANKYLGSRICVSSAVKDAVGDTLPEVEFLPIAAVRLKGKSDSISCFQPHQISKRQNNVHTKAYLAAYQLLQLKSPDACAAFQELVKRWPEDQISRRHLERLQRGENGADFVLTEK